MTGYNGGMKMSFLKAILKVAENVTTVDEAKAIRSICRALVRNDLMTTDARAFITRRIAQALYYNSGITGYSMYTGEHEVYH